MKQGYIILGIESFRYYLGAYLKYNPCNVIDTHHGPKLLGLSAGLIWNW